MCGYDLRGLPAGRCPECGHGFDPVALRHALATRHPYLFEHQQRRLVRSFLRTLVAGWRPKRFWTRLRPGMEIVPRRLKIYALIALTIVLISSFGGLVSGIAAGTRSNLENRRREVAHFQSQSPQEQSRWNRWAGGDYVAYRKQFWPMPTQTAFWQGFAWQEELWRAVPLLGLALAWPTLTLASFVIFRRSLRQARIHLGQMARVVVYSSDVFVFITPVVLVIGTLTASGLFPIEDLVYAAPFPVDHLFLIIPGLDDVLLGTALVLLSLAGWRLWRAYRLYLDFPHAGATVLASQVIVWLALIALGGPALDMILG